MTQFGKWFAEAVAAGLPEPNAMVLATMGDRPHARTVLLKSHDENGFTFYTNRTSRKGNDLAGDPRCCVVFPWYALGRQVTVEGATRQLSMEESEPYYHSRAWRSQIGAWASRQSRVLSSRAELDDRVAELERRWPEGTDVPIPGFWGGYLIVPETVEFWQAGQNRLHDRLRYKRVPGGGLGGGDLRVVPREGSAGGPEGALRDGATGWDIERLSP
jgi:pyridoxamine 5'-phosphate oxidase